MSVHDLLSDLHAAGVRLELDGDRLRYRAPKGALTDELRERLAANKGEVAEVLATSASQDQGGLTPEQIEQFKALRVEVKMSASWCPAGFWLVPEYTDSTRLELSAEDAAVLLRLVQAFPGIQVESLRRDPAELPGDVADWPEPWREVYEERAGIAEHHGCLARCDAERLAEARVRMLYGEPADLASADSLLNDEVDADTAGLSHSPRSRRGPNRSP